MTTFEVIIIIMVGLTCISLLNNKLYTKSRNRGSGQNPLPTKGQIEAHMVKVGDKWVPKGFTCGSDVYYDKPEQPQTPPIPPNARSFGNEAPPREMRKPPTNEGVNEMATKIIVDKRRTGKTTRVIIESAKTGNHILVPNRTMADYIVKMAKEIGVEIPIPVTIKQWKNGRLDGRKRDGGLIVDEGLVILEQLLGTHIHMITMSERED